MFICSYLPISAPLSPRARGWLIVLVALKPRRCSLQAHLVRSPLRCLRNVNAKIIFPLYWCQQSKSIYTSITALFLSSDFHPLLHCKINYTRSSNISLCANTCGEGARRKRGKRNGCCQPLSNACSGIKKKRSPTMMKNGGHPQGGRHDYVGSVVVVGRRIESPDWCWYDGWKRQRSVARTTVQWWSW
jgi:hypothetical protein